MKSEKVKINIGEENIKKVYSALDEGKEVSFNKIGKFSLTKIAKRKGYNPSTGKHEIYPETHRITFNPSKMVKRIIK